MSEPSPLPAAHAVIVAMRRTQTFPSQVSDFDLHQVIHEAEELISRARAELDRRARGVQAS